MRKPFAVALPRQELVRSMKVKLADTGVPKFAVAGVGFGMLRHVNARGELQLGIAAYYRTMGMGKLLCSNC